MSQYFLSIFFYLIFMIIYFFKGLKGDGSNIRIFFGIIFYIFNIVWFYNNKYSLLNKPKNIFPQIILFYFLNLLIVHNYFNLYNIKNHNLKDIIFSLISIFGLFSIIIYIFVNKSLEEYKKKLTKITLVLSCIFGILSLMFYFLTYTDFGLTFATYGINILIIITLLSFISEFFFKDKSKSKDSIIFNLIKSYIFYIPCLFVSFIEYIKYEFKITTRNELLIFIIQILLIGIRIIIPKFYKLLNSGFIKDGNIIEKGPIYLNKKHNFFSIQEYYEKNKTFGSINNSIEQNYNYGLSSKIWINPQPSSTSNAYTTSTNILDYGEVITIKFNKNKLEFYASTTENNKLDDTLVKIYETKNFYYQKWNDIIFNYEGGTLDIFINNKLVSSSINITPIIKYNSVIIGSNKGIHGGIKDIVYYNNVLTKKNINIISS